MEEENILKRMKDRLKSLQCNITYAEKYYQIMTNSIECSDDEINELIEYFIQSEKYECCANLVEKLNYKL